MNTERKSARELVRKGLVLRGVLYTTGLWSVYRRPTRPLRSRVERILVVVGLLLFCCFASFSSFFSRKKNEEKTKKTRNFQNKAVVINSSKNKFCLIKSAKHQQLHQNYAMKKWGFGTFIGSTVFRIFSFISSVNNSSYRRLRCH